MGILSAISEEWRVHGGGQVSHYVRPDLTMYPGFSGGPIVGGDGRVVGLATSALSRDGGIALTHATVAPTVVYLKKHGSVRRGYLGVGVQTVNLPASLNEELGQETGVLLNSVETDSPAETGGLMLGDIIVTFGGEAIRNPDDLAVVLRGDRVGQEVPLRIIRGGTVQNVEVEIREREE